MAPLESSTRATRKRAALVFSVLYAISMGLGATAWCLGPGPGVLYRLLWYTPFELGGERVTCRRLERCCSNPTGPDCRFLQVEERDPCHLLAARPAGGCPR